MLPDSHADLAHFNISREGLQSSLPTYAKGRPGQLRQQQIAAAPAACQAITKGAVVAHEKSSTGIGTRVFLKADKPVSCWMQCTFQYVIVQAWLIRSSGQLLSSAGAGAERRAADISCNDTQPFLLQIDLNSPDFIPALQGQKKTLHVMLLPHLALSSDTKALFSLAAMYN